MNLNKNLVIKNSQILVRVRRIFKNNFLENSYKFDALIVSDENK